MGIPSQREALHSGVMQTDVYWNKEGPTTANVVRYACAVRQRDEWFPIQRELASMKDCGILIWNPRSETWSLPIVRDEDKKKNKNKKE